MTVPSKSNVPSLWPWPLTYEGQFYLVNREQPYKFPVSISEIKYQNIGRTHIYTHTHRQTDTHRQTGWKQYLATPSGGEVKMMPNRRNCIAIDCCLSTVPVRIIIIIEHETYYEQVLLLCHLLSPIITFRLILMDNPTVLTVQVPLWMGLVTYNTFINVVGCCAREGHPFD